MAITANFPFAGAFAMIEIAGPQSGESRVVVRPAASLQGCDGVFYAPCFVALNTL
jgi:hypothetical protein